MKTTTVICDTCEKDVTRVNRQQYCINIWCIAMPDLDDGTFKTVYVKPPIDREHHFCSKECLKEWVNK